MIALIGDTHGTCAQLSNSFIKKQCGGVYPTYLIVLGDFGFIWQNIPDATERFNLKWLNEKPWITLFLDGNHENFERLNSFSNIPMFGSTVGKISDKVFHIKRGNIYTIEGKTFFIMGGAESIDKEMRIPFISWWPEEIPSYKEYKLGKENLEKIGWRVDYILSHTAPKSILSTYFDDIYNKYSDPTTTMLDSIKNNVVFKHWFFGHMHEDRELNNEFSVLYKKAKIIL